LGRAQVWRWAGKLGSSFAEYDGNYEKRITAITKMKASDYI